MPFPVLIVIDVQKDFFLVGASRVGSYEKAFCIPGIQKLLAHARGQGWKIVHVVTEHDGPETLPRFLRKKGTELYCHRGSDGARLLDGVYVHGERVVRKQHFSGYRDTDLAAEVAGHDSVVVAGVSADCCVTLTAFEASVDADVFIPFQAVSASTRQLYEASLVNLGKSAGKIVDLNEVLEANSPLAEMRAVEPQQYVEWYRSMKGALDRAKSKRGQLPTDAAEIANELDPNREGVGS